MDVDPLPLQYSEAWLAVRKSWWVVTSECISVMSAPTRDSHVLCTLEKCAVLRVEELELHGTHKSPWARLADSEMEFVAGVRQGDGSFDTDGAVKGAWILVASPKLHVDTHLAPVPQSHLETARLEIARSKYYAYGLGPEVFDAKLSPSARGPKAASAIKEALDELEAQKRLAMGNYLMC